MCRPSAGGTAVQAEVTRSANADGISTVGAVIEVGSVEPRLRAAALGCCALAAMARVAPVARIRKHAAVPPSFEDTRTMRALIPHGRPSG
jgi:hypothetical protein